METYSSTGNYPGTYFEMTREQAQYCSHQGRCDNEVAETVEELREQLDKIDPDNLRLELDEYGAWDDDELSDHEENLHRWVWVTACNIAEEYFK